MDANRRTWRGSRDDPHGDKSDAHGVPGLRSLRGGPRGTEAMHLAYSACEAAATPTCVRGETHIAEPAFEAAYSPARVYI